MNDDGLDPSDDSDPLPPWAWITLGLLILAVLILYAP